MPGGDGTHRETTIDRLYFNEDGTIKKVVPTLESVDPLTYTAPAPQAAVSHAGSDGWYGKGAELTLTGGDGVKTLQYRIGEGDWKTYEGAVALEAGTNDIDYRAQGDNLQWSDVSSLTAKVDLTDPVVTDKLAERTVTLTASDEDSGVAGHPVPPRRRRLAGLHRTGQGRRRGSHGRLPCHRRGRQPGCDRLAHDRQGRRSAGRTCAGGEGRTGRARRARRSARS